MSSADSRSARWWPWHPQAANAVQNKCRFRVNIFKILSTQFKHLYAISGPQNNSTMAKTRRGLAFNHSSRTTTTTIGVILDILKEVSPLVPVPGLRTVLDIASAILTRIENVRSLGTQFSLLAQGMGALVLAILGELSETTNISISTIQSVDVLLRTLQRINYFVYKESFRSRLSRFLHEREITQELKDYMEQLHNCCKAFQITSLIRVTSLLQTVRASQDSSDEILREIKGMLQTEVSISRSNRQNVSVGLTNLSNAMSTFQHISQRDHETTIRQLENIVQAIPGLRLDGDDGECHIYRQGDVIVTRVLQQQDHTNGPLYLGKTKEDGRPVLLKRYGSGELARKKFAQELPNWRALCHPNLPQLLGHSLLSSENPFVVVTGVTTRDITRHIRAQSASLDPTVGFMVGLSMLQGISSALEYLRSNCKLGKHELQDCVKVSNFLLDNEGRVVLGQNIVHNVPGPDMHNSLKLEQWIIEQFWTITETILFESPYNFTDWEVVAGHRGAAHMRPLLRFAAWYSAQSFASATQRINEFFGRLSDRGPITWGRIREEFLDTEGIEHHMFYRPPERWDVQLFDIGFVQDGKFIKLCNVADQVDYALEYEIPLRFAVFPEITPQVSTLPDGMKRYAFDSPLYSAIVKTASGAKVKQSAEPFRFMIKQAPSLLSEHASRYPNLEVKELIFIVGTNELPQSAAFEWHAVNEHDSGPQRPVFFYEFPVLCEGHPWGFWSFDPTPAPVKDRLHPQVTVSAHSPPQTIVFVQLENDDCARITEV